MLSEVSDNGFVYVGGIVFVNVAGRGRDILSRHGLGFWQSEMCIR